MRIQDRPTRRDLLRTLAAVGAAGVLAGCDLLATPPPEPDPLLGLLAETRALAGAYDRTIVASPELALVLTPIRDAHRQHLAALEQIMKQPSGSAAPAVSQSSAPGTNPKAILLAAEKTAAKTAYDACLTVPAARAALLGEIAAARATHVAVLS